MAITYVSVDLQIYLSTGTGRYLKTYFVHKQDGW
jgi:hypothetical protein